MTLRCAFCEAPIEQQGRGRPRRFCSPRCRDALYRREAREAANKNATNLGIEETLRGMEKYVVQTYGGGPARLAHSTIDGCKRDREVAAKIDSKLLALLGGIPTGRRRGQVIELPALTCKAPGPVSVKLVEAAA